jgi:hypothetical protein
MEKNKTSEQLLQECRTAIKDLIDGAWEMGGHSVGGEEFESYSFIKDARKTIEEIDGKLSEINQITQRLKK